MPAAPLIEELASEYRTLDDVHESLARLEEIFLHQRDRRALFASACRIAAASAKSPAVTIGAANLYRSALLAYESGDANSVPKSWRMAFDVARNNEALLIQDLFLGINAHVNNDWALALGPRRDHQEYLALSQALIDATEQIEARIETMYTPALRLLGRAFHPLAKDITSFDLPKAGQLAWENAQTIIGVRCAGHLSAVLARLILAPTARKLVLDALRKIESVTPWWRFLEPRTEARVVEQPLAVNTLDELIARFNSIAQQYDARRSRMSLDPAVHAEFCAKIKDALANGTFADPAWITRVILHLGTLYLNAVSAFDQGNLDALPDCWFMAFQMATSGENLVLQDVLAALNAHYNYDFPLAVSLSGRHILSDLEKLQILYRDHIIEIEQSIVNRYTEAPILPSLLAGPLQGILGEFPFDRALAQPAPDACAITHRILLKGLPSASWVIHALRHVEGEYRGVWSEWHSEGPLSTGLS